MNSHVQNIAQLACALGLMLAAPLPVEADIDCAEVTVGEGCWDNALGNWQNLDNFAVQAVHLRAPKILIWDVNSPESPKTWDPVDGSFTNVPLVPIYQGYPPDLIGCSGHAGVPGGVLIGGGAGANAGSATNLFTLSGE